MICLHLTFPIKYMYQVQNTIPYFPAALPRISPDCNLLRCCGRRQRISSAAVGAVRITSVTARQIFGSGVRRTFVVTCLVLSPPCTVAHHEGEPEGQASRSSPTLPKSHLCFLYFYLFFPVQLFVKSDSQIFDFISQF